MPHPAKPAVQERSRRTRDALIEALDRLLLEKSFDAIGVAEIAEEAGVSTASIYQRFSNKDATVSILIALYLRRVSEWSRSPEGAVGDVAAAPALRPALMMLGVAAWRQFTALAYVMRPAYLYSRLRPDLLGAEWAERLAQARTGFRGLLEAHRGEIRRTDLGRAADMVAAFYNMMFVGLLLHREDLAAGPFGDVLSSDPHAFASELADFVLGYLATPETMS
jgi:AcrR family transcriptional regulator